jgi:hypothetical protein
MTKQLQKKDINEPEVVYVKESFLAPRGLNKKSTTSASITTNCTNHQTTFSSNIDY